MLDVIFGRKSKMAKRLIPLMVSLFILFVSVGTVPTFRVVASSSDFFDSKTEVSVTKEDSYDTYLSNNAFNIEKGFEIILSVSDAKKDEVGYLWEFDSKLENCYYIKAEYIVKDETPSKIEASIRVNGDIPYKELRDIVLPKEYMNESNPVSDIYGNQIKPEQVVSKSAVSTYIFDYTGVYHMPLSVNIKNGINTIGFYVSEQDILLERIILVPVGNSIDYEDYRNKHSDKKVYDGINILIEGEEATLKSASVLSPVSDKSDPLVSPVKAGTILLNAIGGNAWKTPNQYIKWSVSVEEEGLYAISFKARQNRAQGQKSHRTLYINGEIPFSEVADIEIDYSSKWQLITLGGEKPYLFYLKKGENEITLSSTLGKVDKTIRLVDNAVNELNVIYRKLLMVLGSEPDLTKDYKLDKTVPELIGQMAIMADELDSLANMFEEQNGSKSASIATLRTLARQLRKMNKDSDKIPSEFSYFKTNIGSLGTHQASVKEQPLEIDFFVIHNTDSNLPRPESHFFSQICFDIKEFLSSFVTDYKGIGTIDTKSGEKEITAWIASGRDQSQIIRSNASDSFTPKTGIGVKLELVAASSLLPATVAGIGPDVYIGTSDVINYAMRNAAYNLKQFDDYEAISKRFLPATFIPLQYMDGVYGLPNEISFSVMYYRTDILEELGLSVPKTWNDIISMSSVLSINNMSFGLPSNNTTYLMMIKQKELDIYRENGAVCALDEVPAIDVFQYFTNFYNNYGFPITYSLVNRFRTGETPIAIDTIALYNSLEISAPEIKGLWSFSLVPGFEDENGEINSTALASGNALMMLQKTKNPNESWEFMKWFTSQEIQTAYGNELESRLGTSGRYSSANIEAFNNSLWGSKESAILKEQMKQLSAVEQVPGSYYLTRNLDNAFRNAVYYNQNAMDVMFDYVHKINGELTEKRTELGLDIHQEGN